jgi:hypothetical protein
MARDPIHPGEILADEIEELGISAAELARRLNAHLIILGSVSAHGPTLFSGNCLWKENYVFVEPYNQFSGNKAGCHIAPNDLHGMFSLEKTNL